MLTFLYSLFVDHVDLGSISALLHVNNVSTHLYLFCFQDQGPLTITDAVWKKPEAINAFKHIAKFSPRTTLEKESFGLRKSQSSLVIKDKKGEDIGHSTNLDIEDSFHVKFKSGMSFVLPSRTEERVMQVTAPF